MGFTLKQARAMANMTQKQMADAMEMSERQWQYLEAHPESTTAIEAVRISQISGVNIDALIFTAET